MVKISRAVDNRRVQALQELNILDTAPEHSYDQITKLCAAAFDVPTALISLVDKDRVWYKSKKGVRKKESPRKGSMCGYTISRGGPLIIEDTLLDERTKNMRAVKGKPGYRFYAGVPLVLTSGARVGALCLLDKKPRRLGPHQIATLVRIADIVVQKMELRSSVTRLLWDIEERFDQECYG